MNLNMDLKCEHFNASENLEQQRTLFKDCFPETNGDSIQKNEHYYWKFHSYPTEGKKSWEFVSYIDKDMVGYYAALPYQYKIGTEKVTIGMVCDVMTNSKYRGKGIFTKMGCYSTNELALSVPFIMGYPIRKEVIPGHLKVGWKIAFQMPLYMKFFKTNSLLKSKKIGFFSPFANLCVSLYNSVVHSKVSSRYTCEVVTNIEEIQGYDSLVDEWGKTIPNTLIKNMEFAKWRYGAPNRKYRFLAIKENDKLIAFLSFRSIIKKDVPSYAILDFISKPDNMDCIGLINSKLSELAKVENIEAIMVMMSSSSAERYKLIRNGFYKSPFIFNVIIKNLTNQFGDPELYNENNWHLMWVDSDDL